MKIDSDIANSADPDEMPPNAAFHLGLHLLPGFQAELSKGLLQVISPFLLIFNM